MRFTMYRYSATGAFGYSAFAENEKIFECSTMILPESPVEVTGKNISMTSLRDRDETLVPGFTARPLGKWGKMLWEGESTYRFTIQDRQYFMEERRGRYLAFDRRGRAVLTMTRAPEGEPVPTTVRRQYFYYGDVATYYTCSAEEDLPAGHLEILASYPLLRFAL